MKETSIYYPVIQNTIHIFKQIAANSSIHNLYLKQYKQQIQGSYRNNQNTGQWR